MRIVAFLAGAVALIVTPALAGDLSPNADQNYAVQPAATGTPFDWSGLYFGVNAGYGFGTSRWTQPLLPASSGDFDINGGVAGGTLGYNWQVGTFVFGVEGDFDWMGIAGTTTNNCGGLTCETSGDWLATGRVRLGYALGTWLPYVTGGVAAAGTKYSRSTSTETYEPVGWTAGAGVEVALPSRWSAKLEYLYVDLPDSTCSPPGSSPGSCATPTVGKFNTNLVRAGLNYRF